MAPSFQAARIAPSPLSRTFHFWWVTKSCWPSPQNTCRMWPCLAIYIATAQVPAFLIFPLDDYSRLLISLLGLPLPPVNIFSTARVIFKKHESLWLPCSKYSNAFLPHLEEEPKLVLSSSKPSMMQLHPLHLFPLLTSLQLDQPSCFSLTLPSTLLTPGFAFAIFSTWNIFLQILA